MTPAAPKKEEASPEYQSHEMERLVNQLLEESAAAGLAFTQSSRLRVNMGNIYYEQKKYTLAVKMYRMALDQTPNTHKDIQYRIMRNIGNALLRLGRYQDAAQSYEAVIEIKVDHQTCYNLVVCYYVLGQLEKTKSILVKMLIVHHYDSDDENDDIEGDNSAALRNDGLRVELCNRQSHAFKYILTSARLIAPVLGNSFVEGYDCLIGMLKDQQYIALANEMEMDKALQHLHRQDFTQAILLLKTFERKEKDLKARAATNLSYLYFLEGDHANAEKHAELAVKTNSYNPSALVNHGNCFYIKIGHLYELLGNYNQAIKWLEIVNTRVVHDAGILAMLGNLHVKLGDEPKALHYCYESHKVYPTNMDIISWLGAFHVKSEVYAKAMPYFELASKIKPADVKWQLMVASCYRRTGQYKLALAKYKAILSEHPENIECLRYLVHMCSSLRREEELERYEQLLREAEKSALRGSTGDIRILAARGEKVESGSSVNYKQQHNSQTLLEDRSIHDTERAHTLELVYSFLPAETTTMSRMPTEGRNDNEDWPELGDDLLPM
ncbi:hypothetical protein R1sor_006479 [Riccia sorocarpa]|uniref:Bardet-Biedl syndrome 4 n=1 Tax=Riccia sorocarpa TaxID=122646 RepID=A0ABD3HN52_9MARC